MQSQTVLTWPVAGADKSVPVPHWPVRVFVLSDCRLLREAFARALKNHAAISLVGAEEFSAVTTADIIASDCDVLLMDLNTRPFDSRILDDLQPILSDFRIVLIELEATISDVLSSILALARSEERFVRKANRTGP